MMTPINSRRPSKSKPAHVGKPPRFATMAYTGGQRCGSAATTRHRGRLGGISDPARAWRILTTTHKACRHIVDVENDGSRLANRVAWHRCQCSRPR